MLAQALSSSQLKTALIPRDQWHPYPTADERDAWNSLPERVRTAHLDRGNKALNAQWSTLPATEFMAYFRTGDYMDFQAANFARRHRLRDLVTAECIEGKGRFLDEIINGIWHLCEESFWGLSPNTFVQASEEDQVKYSNQQLQEIRTLLPDISKPGFDLWVGETAGVLAWTVYLLQNQLNAITPLITQRVQLEAERRVLIPCLERNFLWMGFLGQRTGNWNPWCNTNYLTTALILDTDETRRAQAVEKIIQSLDIFISHYKPDGGCDEGPSYWGRAAGCLFEALELLNSATNGAINIYDKPLIKEMAAYIYRVHISDRYFVNFADAPGSIRPAANLVHQFGQRIGDNHLQAFGAWAAQEGEPTIVGSLGRELPAIFNAEHLDPKEIPPPQLRDVWLSDIQVMTARSVPNSNEGLYLAVKGGHNREHHNHNDVGNFIVYTNGLPAIIDVGAGTYTAKNSGPDRYDIWNMHSGYHNLPTINAIRQGYGEEFAARVLDYKTNDAAAHLSLELANAYPPQAKLTSWTRTLTLNRNQNIQLVESYELQDPVEELTLSLITPCTIKQADGLLHLQTTPFDTNRQSGTVKIHYNPDQLVAQIETIKNKDKKIQASWGKRLYRILFRATKPPLKDTYHFQITQA